MKKKKPDMEEPKRQLRKIVECDLCGSREHLPILHHGEPGEIVRCRNCGLIFRGQRASDDILKDNYVSLNYKDPEPGWVRSRTESFMPYLGKLEQWRSYGRVCDIGAGHGFNLASCRDNGWECAGIEVVKDAVDYAQRELGIKLFHGTLQDAAFQADNFDAVMFWNVLDELPSPRTELRESLQILRPGGGILIRVRNADFHLLCSRLINIFSKNSAKEKSAVIHLYAFDHNSIHKMLDISGFRNIRVDNAKLTWSKMHGAADHNLVRNLLIFAVQTFSTGIKLLTGGHLLLAPSLIISAEKPEPVAL